MAAPTTAHRAAAHNAAPTPLDSDLVEAARAGDHAAFVGLVRRHDDRMRGLAYKLLTDRSRMDDALQEAYLKAYRALGTFKAGSDFGTWLYRITYNACIDELRRLTRTPQASGDPADPPSPSPGPERVVGAAETVRRALATLPPDQRLTVVLVDGEGFDHRGAAKVLGVAPGTVASRLHRARAALRAQLTEELA
jgi:RNA polymerase sigma-70 factor, ECF subfamily